jgi:hypothetical protein
VKLSMAFSGRELRFKDQGKELMLVGGWPGGRRRGGAPRCVWPAWALGKGGGGGGLAGGPARGRFAASMGPC